MNIAQLTSQFPHCGNAFRIDLYRYCPFECRYCFAQNRGSNFTMMTEEKATKKQILDLRGNRGIIGELIKERVPMHCGGLSDPFQDREFEENLTLRLINEFKDYPIMFSTKTSHLPDEYFEILNPQYHVFQISISGIPKEHIRRFEPNAPLTEERIQFCAELKQRGFTVMVRIQPLISLDWAQDVVWSLGNTVNNFTIEHLDMLKEPVLFWNIGGNYGRFFK